MLSLRYSFGYSLTHPISYGHAATAPCVKSRQRSCMGQSIPNNAAPPLTIEVLDEIDPPARVLTALHDTIRQHGSIAFWEVNNHTH